MTNQTISEEYRSQFSQSVMPSIFISFFYKIQMKDGHDMGVRNAVVNNANFLIKSNAEIQALEDQIRKRFFPNFIGGVEIKIIGFQRMEVGHIGPRH